VMRETSEEISLTRSGRVVDSVGAAFVKCRRNAGSRVRREVQFMRRVLAFVTVISMMAPASSVFAAARAVQGPPEGSISGTASTSTGQTVANATVRLRNLTTGQLSGTTVSDAAGSFSFSGLSASSYVVEVVNAVGEIVGTSASIAVAAGAVVTGVVVAASAAAVAGVGVAAAAGVAAGGFFSSTAGIIAVAASGAAVAGVTVAATSTTASPSR